ncbi:MAG: PAS-domain containing protein [Pseudomonadota bacterium]
MAKSSSSNIVQNLFGPLTGVPALQEEKTRLEAFLSAFPGAYCGFADGGNVLYSAGFLNILGIDKIKNIHDIQNALTASDAAVLEGMFYRLQEEEKQFSIDVSPQKDKNKTYRITGSKGCAINNEECFTTVWIEDVTEDLKKITTLKVRAEGFEKELGQFKETLNLMNQAIWIRRANGDIVWCNDAYATILGTNAKEVVKGQKEFSISPKDKTKIKSIKALSETALQKGEDQEVSCHIIASGKRYFVQLAACPLKGTDMTVGFLTDLTREKEASTDYERYLTANKTLMEQLRSAICIFDSDQRLEFFNSSFAQLWSLEEQWLNTNPRLGEILEKLREMRRLPEEADFKNYKQGWLDMFSRVIEAEEDMMYLPDNTALRRTVIPHPMGGIMLTFEDVTSNLELESSYNTLIAVQKETLDNLAEGVAVYGGHGRLRLYNPSFANLWKFNPEDLESKPHISTLVARMSSFFDTEDWEKQEKLLTSHGLERQIQEGRIARNDGTLIEYATVPLPDGGILVSYFDVTDSAQVETALREKNTALEVAEQIKTDFLANVSYQLRTPLNAIMGFAEILDNEYFGELNDKQKEYSQGIQEAGDKLVRLIDDILDLSTIEAGYLDLAMNEFDIHEVLKNIHSLTKEWGRKENITVELKSTKKSGSLIADERRVKQVLLNLIHNAINFTPKKGKITLDSNRDDTYVYFKITDTGVGISKADQQRIFEPFERANHDSRTDMSSNSLSRGAGLGLSLVKNITELHGGYVDIESEKGKGTTIIIALPVDPVLEPLL